MNTSLPDAVTAAPPPPRRPVLDPVNRVVDAVVTALGTVGMVLVGLLALMIFVDVIARNAGSPIQGVVEVSKMSIVLIAFLLAPYALKADAHVRSTLIRNRLGARGKAGVDAFSFVAGIVVFGLIAWASLEPTVLAWERASFEGEGAFRVPVWPARGVILVASALMVLQCVLKLVDSLGRVRTGEEADDE